jgi:hypothetical protein
LAWWEVEAGGSHDSPWSWEKARWWVDGTLQPRPKDWHSCGHLEWHPDGQTLVAAVRPYWWWVFAYPDFRPYLRGVDGRWVQAPGTGPKDYDPAFTPDGRLIYASKNPTPGVCTAATGHIPVSGGEPFDPLMSPDGRWIVVLVVEALNRHRLDVIEIATGRQTTIVPGADRTSCSAGRWLDDGRLLVCRLLPDDALTWRPWIVEIDGKATPCWSAKAAQVIGSIEYAHPLQGDI